jgi:hypothetical protein
MLLAENLPPLSANSFETDLTEIKIAANSRYLSPLTMESQTF